MSQAISNNKIEKAPSSSSEENKQDDFTADLAKDTQGYNKQAKPRNVVYKDQEPKKVLSFGPNLFVSRQFKVAVNADTGDVWNTYDLINIRKKGYGYKNFSIDINFFTSQLPLLIEALKEIEKEIVQEEITDDFTNDCS